MSMAEYYSSPGYMIRRCYQIVQGIFQDAGCRCADRPGPTRRTAGHRRTSGSRSSIDRPRTRGRPLDDGHAPGSARALGYLTRYAAAHDKRVKLLAITPAGVAAITATTERLAKVRERFLQPLDEAERATFVSLMQRIIEANNDFGRAHQRAIDDFAA